MKKIISYLLFFALLMGSLALLSFAAEETDTPYSGGSGTEDDPYLISTEEDIAELRNAIKTDVSLWYTKYYYKLTNDIETSYNLNIPSCSTDFSESSFQLADEDLRSSKLVPIYEYVEGEWTPAFNIRKNDNKYYNEYFNRYGGEGYPWDITRVTYYWNAGFTGIFDGNGHTIKMKNDGCFFGFIENESVVKDLTVEGDGASFAYCVDQTSLVLNCSVKDADIGDTIEYNCGMVIDGITESGFGYSVTENSEVCVNVLLEYDDNVVIPETINGLPVVSIGPKAFVFKDVEIESLYIPGSITHIASNAFGGSYKSGSQFTPDAVIETVYYNGTRKMLYDVFSSTDFSYDELSELYNVVYDYSEVEGFALKDGETEIVLEIGETFNPKYEYYPENGRSYMVYSFAGGNISMEDGLIKALNPGETFVTVTAENGLTYEFTVKVLGCVGIEIASLPHKVNYSIRQPLDLTGLVVEKVYNNGTRNAITEYTVSGYNVLKAGVQTITVTVDAYTATFEVYTRRVLPGDADLDGSITSIDSNYLKRFIAGSISVDKNDDFHYACDINGDGKINAVDSALLKRMITG